MKTRYVKVCPNCGSANVSLYTLGDAGIFNCCNDCGHGRDAFKTSIFPEMTRAAAERYRKKRTK